MIKLACFHCQKELSFSGKIGLREECPFCRSDVHVCKNCHFYDPKVYNECRETAADVVREKDRANFCDYFQTRVPGGDAKTQADQLKATAEAHFKKN